MSTRQRRLRPTLDRRNATRNIDYDASMSSSSSSFCEQPAHRTRSLDVSPPLANCTSFRVEGIEGEFDRIFQSLGLSGPEDFAIPVAAWEASRSRSLSDRFSVSRLQSNCSLKKFEADESCDDSSSDAFEVNVCVDGERPKPGSELCKLRTEESPHCRLSETIEAKSCVIDEFPNSKSKLRQLKAVKSPGSRLPEAFEANVSFSDELKTHGNELYQLRGASLSGKVVVRDKEARCNWLNGLENSLSVRRDGFGECGIKGVRPPVLAPPPAMSRFIVDNESSTWDIFKGFGPEKEESFGSRAIGDFIRPLNQTSGGIEGSGVVGRSVIAKHEENEVKLNKTLPLSEPLSNSTHDLEDDDSGARAMEPYYFISPNGKFNCSIKSWQKGDFLGSGSFGTVYEGFTDDGFFFAVKEVSLLDQGIQAKQSISQLQHEIDLLSQFEHENIVRYLGTDKDDGKLYIFLELVTKGSLSSLYQKYTLWDSQVSAYTRQILSGLKYLHSQNVVHRDIKCANLLVDANGSVKLADFGLAKETKLNDVKSCKGTAFWMAPEVVNRKSQGYGLAADIWSLGCTVLEMLTRQIPYSHLEGMQALFRIGKGEPPPIPNSLSKDAQDFIFTCLQVNPDHRPSASQLLDHPFVKKPLSSFSIPASPRHYVAKS